MSQPLTPEERAEFLDPEQWGDLVGEFSRWEATVVTLEQELATCRELAHGRWITTPGNSPFLGEFPPLFRPVEDRA